jgi:hypothetical protein
LLAKILDEVLPAKNKKEPENYAALLEDLIAFSITSETQLRKLISTHLDGAIADDKKEVERRSKQTKPQGTSKERIEQGVFWTHAGLTRQTLSRMFGAKWSSYQNRKFAEQQALLQPKT